MVSVTVPVFNTSQYLRKCLDSLREQSLRDIEFIIVNDGSTDSSGKICDEYAQKDSRFHAIHQKNSGLAAARQTGLEAARGEYIIVCDSDDWVEPDMYEKLYQKAKETDADIVCCGYFTEYNNGMSMPRQAIFKECDSFVDNYEFIARGAGNTCVKLVKRSLFNRSDSNYEPGINLSEDALIIYKLMRINPKVVQIKENLYHYRRLFGGSSYTNNLKMTSIYQLYFTYNWLVENYSDRKFEPIRFARAIDLAFACLRVSDLDKAFLKDFLKTELPIDRIYKNSLSAKSVVVLIEKLFSIPVAKAIVNHLYRYVYK